jgi:hypothetical protein
MGSLVTGVVLPTPCTISTHEATCVQAPCNGTCSVNSWWGAYPHFFRCSTLSCSFKTSLPKAAGHCSTANFLVPDGCLNTSFFDDVFIKDCGPGYTSAVNTSVCKRASGLHGIASLGPGLFKSVTGNSRGYAYMTISVQ